MRCACQEICGDRYIYRLRKLFALYPLKLKVLKFLVLKRHWLEYQILVQWLEALAVKCSVASHETHKPPFKSCFNQNSAKYRYNTKPTYGNPY